MSKLKVGSIFIDENGYWWCYYVGDHAEQGGTAFTGGNIGAENIEDLLKIVSKNMDKNKHLFLKKIKELKKKRSQ